MYFVAIFIMITQINHFVPALMTLHGAKGVCVKMLALSNFASIINTGQTV